MSPEKDVKILHFQRHPLALLKNMVHILMAGLIRFSWDNFIFFNKECETFTLSYL